MRQTKELPGYANAGAENAARNSSGAAAAAAHENFPVALRLLPARHRRHLMALYVYARTVDDIGDRAPAADRLERLAEVEDDVRRLFGAGEARLAVVRGLGPLASQRAVPMQPFLDLIQANRQDQVVARYQTFDDLLGYCRLSANPVGRIVLWIFGSFSPDRAELSDSVCTALQLAEHWQDVAEDLAAGRVYLPAEDLRRYGCTEADLAESTASLSVRRLIGFEAGRARELLDAGAPLIGRLRGWARVAVAGYVAGGRATLAAIEAADGDVLAATVRPGRARTAAELARALGRGR
jgi:squalene synthase HpnC